MNRGYVKIYVLYSEPIRIEFVSEITNLNCIKTTHFFMCVLIKNNNSN